MKSKISDESASIDIIEEQFSGLFFVSGSIIVGANLRACARDRVPKADAIIRQEDLQSPRTEILIAGDTIQ